MFASGAWVLIHQTRAVSFRCMGGDQEAEEAMASKLEYVMFFGDCLDSSQRVSLAMPQNKLRPDVGFERGYEHGVRVGSFSSRLLVNIISHDPSALGAISDGVAIPYLLVTVAVASSAFPRKFWTASEKVNSTPTSSAVTLTSARRDPWKGARDALTVSKAAELDHSAAETLQKAESVREAPPEEDLPSRRRVPQRPAICKFPKNEGFHRVRRVVSVVTQRSPGSGKVRRGQARGRAKSGSSGRRTTVGDFCTTANQM